jgi:acetyl esterase/lipase
MGGHVALAPVKSGSGWATPPPSRRALLLGSSSALLLAACGPGKAEPAKGGLRPGGIVRSAYGEDPSQFGYLALPDRSRPLATVVLIHGGAWEAGYDYKSMTPMGQALVKAGFAVWAIEYRRLGAGGGWPSTFEDVARGIDHLSTLSRRHPAADDEILTRRAALVGHSAGGQLAVWAASRRTSTPGGLPAFAPSGVVSLAGPLDLTAASRFSRMGRPVRSLMGGSVDAVPEHYRAGDPTLLVPASVPVWAVHPVYDVQVPLSQATSYVAADRSAGGEAELVQVSGSHNTVIDPGEPSWTAVLACITKAAQGPAVS